MKTIAVLDADLEQTPLGTRSRLADRLAGTPVLRRTVDRLAQCRNLASIHVTCPPSQSATIANLLAGTPAFVQSRSTPAPAFRALVRTARKWSLDGWRGGLGGSTALDEYVDPAECAALAASQSADAVAVIPPGAAVMDPALVDDLIAHAREHVQDSRLTFAQAPPGIAPTVFQTPLCMQLAEKQVPPGWALAYKPDDPCIDLVFRPCNYPVPQAIRYAAGRLTADTARSWRTLERVLSADRSTDAAEVCAYLNAHADVDPGLLPREVEIELTTDDPLANTPLRPRGPRVPQRGPIDPAVVSRVALELAGTDDDALVVLGGFGDPVCHPRFAETVASVRAAGIYGLCIYTTGQKLSDAAIAALVEQRVDVVVFQLDAWTEATYRLVSGGAELDAARQSLARLSAARQQARQVEPIVVPQFTKSTLNVEELDAFYDGWMRAQGCAAIVGCSHYGGRLPDLRVVDMAPPSRQACRRIFSRCVVLADGRVAACDQDFTGELILGDLHAGALGTIWQGEAARRLRARHLAGELTGGPLCAACTEWHRP